MSSLVPYQNALAILQAANLGYQIQEPNMPQIPYPTDPNGVWIVFEPVGHTLNRMGLGITPWDEEGYINMFVMVPSGTGSVIARSVAKTIVDLYRDISIKPVEYKDASIGLSQMDAPDGDWWGLGVSIEYSYQDIKTS